MLPDDIDPPDRAIDWPRMIALQARAERDDLRNRVIRPDSEMTFWDALVDHVERAQLLDHARHTIAEPHRPMMGAGCRHCWQKRLADNPYLD